MDKGIIILNLFILSLLISNAQDTTKILFIGNSITYYNDMPETFENIANSLGKTVDITMYAPGGTGIVNHVTDPNVYNLFRQTEWDYFVLQPGSNESPGYSYTPEITMGRIDTLLDSLYKYNPCTKVLFYQIPYGVLGNTAADVVSYNNSMDLILANNKYWADSIRSFFAPVGEAFRTSWNNNQNDMLWIGYSNVHPNAKGSYIAACVFYASIFQEQSHGTNIINSLSQSAADSCQLLADSIVLNHFSDWRINTYNQVTDYNFTINNLTVNFENLSQNTDSFYWDFGDGYTSNEINPQHTYTEANNYFTSLTSYKHACKQAVFKNIVISSLNNFNNKTDIILYPNPGEGVFTINFKNIDDRFDIKIYNSLGEEIYFKYNINGKLNITTIDINSFKNGFYYVSLRSNKKTINLKYIKQ